MIYATSSPTSYGNDYAEMFPVSEPAIEAGDIVSVDVGIPVSMQRAFAGSVAPLAGVVSTEPGQTLGDTNAVGYRPIALSGRVPTKVNLEGGSIAVGDRIAPSSVPGVGKRATPFDDSVGIALSAYDGTNATATVMTFIDLQHGTKIDTFAAALLGDMQGLQLLNGSTTASYDFVGGTMHAIASRIASALGLSATTTDATSTAGVSDVNPFIRVILSAVSHWLSDAGNGIADIVTGRIFAREVCITDDTGSSTCITKDSLGNLTTSAGTIPSSSALLAAGAGSALVVSPIMGGGYTVHFGGSASAAGTTILTVDAIGGAIFTGGLTAASLELGSAENPGGVTMYDTVTKQPFCTQITNGKLETIAGRCGSPVPQATSTVTTDAASTAGAPTLTLNGLDPAHVDIGSQYVDLGVVVHDDKDSNLGVHAWVDGAASDAVVIDTSVAGTHTVTYRVTENDGNSTELSRTVIVGQPVQDPVAATTETTASTTDAAPANNSSTSTPDTAVQQ
jgi:hypothetical protein